MVRVGRLHLDEVKFGDRPDPIRDSIETLVVEGDKSAACGEMDVGLKVLYPSLTALSNASSVFSGASPAPPRWAIAIAPRRASKRWTGVIDRIRIFAHRNWAVHPDDVQCTCLDDGCARSKPRRF